MRQYMWVIDDSSPADVALVPMSDHSMGASIPETITQWEKSPADYPSVRGMMKPGTVLFVDEIVFRGGINMNYDQAIARRADNLSDTNRYSLQYVSYEQWDEHFGPDPEYLITKDDLHRELRERESAK